MKRLKTSNGTWVEDDTNKLQVVTEYFKDLFQTSNPTFAARALFGINLCLNDALKSELYMEFQREEV